MATGDAAAGAGYEVVPGGKDLKLGYDDINLTRDYIAALKAQVAAQALPAGTSIEGHWAVAPTGYFFEDGSVKNRAAYPALYAAIGTRYNTGGEAATDFRLPDSRGRVTAGKSNTGWALTLGAKVGTDFVALNANELPSHSHGYRWGEGAVQAGGDFGAMIPAGFNIARNSDSTGSNSAHENRQSTIVVNRAIKY